MLKLKGGDNFARPAILANHMVIQSVGIPAVI